MTDKGKITKFGDMFEGADGVLNFVGFIVDGERRFERTDIAIMTLVKERIEKEINLLNKRL